MKTKHTAGPWQYSGTLNGPDIIIHQEIKDPTKETLALNGGPGFIARVSTDRKSGLQAIGTEHEANARLIAAAPRLLSALRGVLACHGPVSTVAESAKALREAEAAIAAATEEGQ